MQERSLRKWHRKLGALLGFFILLQGFSGLLIWLKKIISMPEVFAPVINFLSALHTSGFGWPGNTYRLIAGSSAVLMALTGICLWLKIRSRQKT